MPWKAKNRQYRCTGCSYVIGGLSVPLNRVNPTGLCPRCGARLKRVECDHAEVRQIGKNRMCRVCGGIVVWMEDKK